MEDRITYKEFREDLRKWFSKDDPKGGWKRIGTDGSVQGPCARPDKDGDGDGDAGSITSVVIQNIFALHQPCLATNLSADLEVSECVGESMCM